MRTLDLCQILLNLWKIPSFCAADVSKSDNDGITSYRNVNFWTQKDNRNPHKKRPTVFQRGFSLNFLAGIIDESIFLADNFNAGSY